MRIYPGLFEPLVLLDATGAGVVLPLAEIGFRPLGLGHCRTFSDPTQITQRSELPGTDAGKRLMALRGGLDLERLIFPCLASDGLLRFTTLH